MACVRWNLVTFKIYFLTFAFPQLTYASPSHLCAHNFTTTFPELTSAFWATNQPASRIFYLFLCQITCIFCTSTWHTSLLHNCAPTILFFFQTPPSSIQFLSHFMDIVTMIIQYCIGKTSAANSSMLEYVWFANLVFTVPKSISSEITENNQECSTLRDQLADWKPT